MTSRRGEIPAPRRTNLHAVRAHALWRIATYTNEEQLAALLDEAAAALRPGHPFVARIARVDHDELVIEIASRTGSPAVGPGNPGERVQLAATAESDVVRSGRTRAWSSVTDDLRLAALPDMRSAGWRCLIATPFRVGSSIYTLSFFSTEKLPRPFDVDDREYVEIVAQAAEQRLLRRWQTDRLRDQLQHDPLTGLVSRARFRALAQAAFDDAKAGAILVINVEGLRRVNDAHGHLVGDDLLVVTGTTLAAANRDGEFCGRLYGGTFAIAFPGEISTDALDARIRHYAAIFRTPFPIGDRSGLGRIALDASFGVAVAPRDGGSADALIGFAATTLGAPPGDPAPSPVRERTDAA